jgi:N-acetylglucosaminyldiphosphoundecaprenol N-acetyl-beta-D-mannosaminyltransferase
MPDFRSVDILGVRVNVMPFDEAVESVLNAPETGDKLAIHFATAHSLVEANRDPQLCAALNADVVEPDGVPLVWLARRRGAKAERVAGPDFLPALVQRGVPLGRSHFFFGGAPGVPEELVRRLQRAYPGVRIVGTLSPPFRALTPEEDEAFVAQINATKADYVWVGLGAPKQDLWVSTHRPRLEASALLAVGAAFDFHAGRKRRAPRPMQRTGTEWVFRLLTEPRRLAGRYTVGNARLLWLLLKDRRRKSSASAQIPSDFAQPSVIDAPIPSVEIGGIPVNSLTLAETVKLITSWVADGSGGTVYTPNVDDVVKAHRMEDFRAAVLGMRLRVPDGMGIVYGSRIAGCPLKGTVTGRLLPESLAATLSPDVRLAFFGGEPGVAQEAARALESKGARNVAALAPGMGFVVGSDEDLELTRQLRESGARVIFVCLGAPRQALWMARHAGELPAVLIGVGAAVDILAGRSPAAPAWMTRRGVEWTFRLIHEPRRLARRYLWDDPRFFWWMLQQRVSRRGGR